MRRDEDVDKAMVGTRTIANIPPQGRLQVPTEWAQKHRLTMRC